MGLIRVSDHAEKIIKEHSNGRTITATVDAILAGSVAPDGTEIWKGNQDGSGSIIEYLDKKFAHLESLIEDTAVDRLDNKSNRIKEYVDWPVLQEIFYEVCRESDAPEWVSTKVHDDIDNLSDELTCFVQDGMLYSEDAYGHYPILKVTPRVREVIER